VEFLQQGDTFDSVAHAKNTGNEATVAAQQAMYSQPCTLSQLQEREADIRALADLSRALDKKASATCLVFVIVFSLVSEDENGNHLCY
jgi:hypothetical protein